ncbi:MAG TPA: hypothetical protein VFX98_07600 [Longimicrobiaceae bacterium]|nr:hypothetical protein [Longimicrobiaceae bacterium]
MRIIRTIAAAVLLAALPACGGDGPSEPGGTDRLDVRAESEHLVYLSATGDGVDSAWMEGYYDWVTGQLGVDPGVKLEYRKYRDRAHLQRVTGRATNGFADPGTNRFHTIWPIDNHEIVHVLVILEIGHPPALFNEGIAVAHQALPASGIFHAQWNGRNVHAIAAEHLAANRIPAVSVLLQSPDFFQLDQGFTYPVAGSFVRFLIDRYGMAPLRTYFGGSTFNDAEAKSRSLFAAAYGMTLDAAWAEWRAFLAALPA